MAYKNYKIKDNWLDIDKYNVVDVQSVDGVIQGVKVNGEDAGGGGGGDLLAVGIYNTYNTTVTLRYFEEQGASSVVITVESGAGIAMSVPKNSGFMVTSSQYKMESKTADAFTIESVPFASAMVLNAGVLFLTQDIQ